MFLVPSLNFWFKVCFIFVESCSQLVKLRLIGGLIKFYFHSGSVHDQSSFLIWDDKICWNINGFPQISHFYPARCCLSPPLNCEWDTIELIVLHFLILEPTNQWFAHLAKSSPPFPFWFAEKPDCWHFQLIKKAAAIFLASIDTTAC